MVYVPNYSNGNCAVLNSSDVIRVYETRPTTNSTISYIDYYINSHYLSNNGTQTFNNYVAIPNCRNDITTDFYYRNDLSDILFILLMFILVCVIAPITIFLRIAKRFRW